MPSSKRYARYFPVGTTIVHAEPPKRQPTLLETAFYVVATVALGVGCIITGILVLS